MNGSSYLYQAPMGLPAVSAGSLQCTRAKLLSASTLVHASSNTVYRAELQHVAEDPSNFAWQPGKKASSVTGARQLPAMKQAVLGHLTSEVQSISNPFDVNGTLRIAAVDGRGRGALFNADGQQAPVPVVEWSVPGVVEAGWCGVSQMSNNRVAVASGFSRTITVVDCGAASASTAPSHGQAASTVAGAAGAAAPRAAISSQTYTSNMPTALACVPSGPQRYSASAASSSGGPGVLTSVAGSGGLLVSTEGSYLCVWDVRAQRPCVSREMVGNHAQTLYCLDVDADAGLIAVAGTEATVHVLDARTWKAAGKWQCPAKYDVTGLALHGAAGIAFVAGADQEVLAGRWGQAMSSWTASRSGLSAAEAADTAAGALAKTAAGSTNKGGHRQAKAQGGGGGEGRHVHDGGFTGGSRKRPADSELGPESSADADTPQASGTPSAQPARLASFNTGFRGDGRWIGFSLLRDVHVTAGASAAVDRTTETDADSRAPSSTSATAGSGRKGSEDVLLAVSDGGYAYVVRQAENMCS